MSFIPPQLLTAARVAPEGERWLHEVKFDGYRLGAHVDGGRVRLYTRGGHDWTKHLRPVEAAVAGLGLRGAYLDGEVVAVAADGLPDFDALHLAMRGGRNAPPLVYHVFDVLKLRGRELFHVDIAERKRMLAELIGAGGDAIRYVDHLVGSGPKLFAHAYSLGIEGIVSKRIGSGYQPGERSARWLKVKCYHVQRMTVARIGDGDVAVVDDEGAHAGWVPVYSRLRLAALRPGDAVTVKALARRAGRMLRHATLLAEDAESVIAP